MAELKTKENDANVSSFLASIEDEPRRKDAEAIAAMMTSVTRLPARMWGTSIVGYGSQHYKYPTGREGDWLRTGFSPRKGSLTVYINSGFARHPELMAKLGTYTTGVSCLYIKRLADVDQKVLRQLVAQSLETPLPGADALQAPHKMTTKRRQPKKKTAIFRVQSRRIRVSSAPETARNVRASTVKGARESMAKSAKKKTAKKSAAKKTATKGAAKKTAKKSAARKTAKKSSGRKPNAAFMAPVTPSATLGEVVGSKPLPRTELTKKLWAYIKKNGLQDAKNRRMINADDRLRPIFGGKSQVSMFDMTKLVNKHVK
jgi:upstream activation factor subunit UAF30